MSLTDDEQRALELIERELRRGDPVLADRMEGAPTNEQRRRRVVAARRGIWLGVAVMLIGLMAAQGLVSLGAVVAGYGVVVVLIMGIGHFGQGRVP